ncbi:DUF1835 domain-containing protein [Paenibacillus sp. Marseille-Q4541]|uniref:DUF1835 domain-containing protein n=1 Tax=Paenibacillus sp. Marseille-Q4541 TaxID=2831522 RepID=UPI001BA77E08|nr:DUF1835 domain-containing protein [Paenibacillus sp. Marseille-Q4541]
MKPHKLEEFVQFVLQECEVQKQDDSVSDSMLSTKITSEWNDALLKSRIESFTEEGAPEHIHIVSSASAAGLLKVSLSKAEVPRNYVVYYIEDFFSIGPLKDLMESEGKMRRMLWLANRLGHDYYLFHRHNDVSALQPVLAGIPADKVITIWTGNNAHEQIFLRLMLFVLRDVKATVRVINAVESYHSLQNGALGEESLTEMQVDWPLMSFGQMDSDKVVLLILQCKPSPLSVEERSSYAEEWIQISTREENLRVWLQGELHYLPVDDYDERIMTVVKEIYRDRDSIDDEHKKLDYIKAGYTLDILMNRYPELMSDLFFDYRIKELIGARKLDFIGPPTALYRYYIKPL